MKTIFSFLLGVFILFSASNVFARQAYFDWENDLNIFIGYNEQTDMIEALGSIASETNQHNEFSLGIYVDGREYRKFFKYNDAKKLLYVNFEIPQDLKDNTSIYLSVKDAQYNEVFTTIPANFNFSTSSSNTNTSVLSVFPSSGERDYGVFSMYPSTSGKQVISHHGSSGTQTNKRQNVSDLTRSDLLNRINAGDYTKDEIPEIIKSLEKYNIIEKNTYSQNTQNTTTSTKKYVPKYSSQENEPNTINGIGNSSSKKSWRVH